MEDYKPNSNKYKAEQKSKASEKKIEKVVNTPVKVKKKGEMRKLADTFISEDARNVKSYIVSDVLVPTIKETIADIISNSVNMIFFGNTSGNKSRSRSSSNVPYVSYRSYSDDSSSRRRNEISPRSRFDLDEIIFETKGDAEAVLEQMRDIIDVYKIVTVADLYDMVDLSAPYTANRYGWNNLTNAYSERLRGGGYVLRLSRPIAID